MKYLITILTCISMGLTADGTIGGVTYFDFYNQDSSAWAWEIELRTFKEKF